MNMNEHQNVFDSTADHTIFKFKSTEVSTLLSDLWLGNMHAHINTAYILSRYAIIITVFSLLFRVGVGVDVNKTQSNR